MVEFNRHPWRSIFSRPRKRSEKEVMSKQFRPRLSLKENRFLQEFRRKKTNRLVVGDIHLPYTHPRYLQHCIDTYNKYDCNAVSFTGDIIDSHFSSFHTTNTNTHGEGIQSVYAFKHRPPSPWHSDPLIIDKTHKYHVRG